MYVKTFQQISKTDAATAGGKGSSLGEMTHAGIPVPDGFVITTNAYKYFSGKNFSEAFKEEIFKSFNNLKSERVAVRSSAVAEDSSSASWAGQLESYLNVKKEDLLDAVKNCWNSIKSARASAYASDQNATSEQLIVAVVVQKMVDSEISGVMFTVNPVTKNSNEIMIEACYGLGELLVQGEITPDNYIVDKKSLNATENTLGSQDVMMVYQNDENKKIPVPDDIKNISTLNAAQLKDLAGLGIRIENHYKFPQDIEWALEKGIFYIVQSRPITT